MDHLPVILTQEIRFHRKTQSFFCLGLLGVGGILMYWGLHEEYGTFLTVSGGFLITLTLLGALHIWDLPPFHKDKLEKVLLQRSDEVVWVYHHVIQNRPYGVSVMNFTMLYICLDTGKEITIRIRLKNADAILDALKPLLPQATFGYSDEKKFMYEANPLLLKKND